jgi:hypothetical protein
MILDADSFTRSGGFAGLSSDMERFGVSPDSDIAGYECAPVLSPGCETGPTSSL